MKNSFIFLLLLFFINGCGGSGNEQQQQESNIPEEEIAVRQLHDEVIAIHDEVMPKMDQLMRLKGKLQARLDSLNALPSDTVNIRDLKEGLKAISNADSAMMTWMRQFEPVMDSLSYDARMDYLDKEKERIEAVRLMMNQAIEDAQEVIKN